jgi:ankyrin repeat protein
VVDAQGNLPLQRALEKKLVLVADQLFAKLPDNKVSHQNFSRTSILLTALGAGHTSVATGLLDKGADVNVVDASGSTALNLAVGLKELPLFKKILSQSSPRVINLQNDGSIPVTVQGGIINPLLLAALADQLPMMQALLDAGANPNPRILGTGDSVLHLVAQGNKLSMVDLLLKHNPDLRVKNSLGETALHLAKGSVAQSLVNAGAPLEVTNNKGETPLVVAFKKSEADTLFLISKGAKLNFVGNNGSNLIHKAAGRGFHQVLTALAKRLNVNAQDSQGRTAFFYANSPETIKALAKLPNADTEIKADSGNTVFVSKVKSYLFQLSDKTLNQLRALIEVGANVNATDKDDLPVTFAIMQAGKKPYDIIPALGSHFDKLWSVLLQSKLNLNVQDKEGETILFQVDRPEEVRVLRQGSLAGPIDETIESKSNATALRSFENRLSMVDYFVEKTGTEVAELEVQWQAAAAAGDTDKAKELEEKLNLKRSRLKAYQESQKALTTLVNELKASN